MSIRYDITDAATLAYCTATGCHWRHLVDSKAQGASMGYDHQLRVHPTDQQGIETTRRANRTHRRPLD